MTSAFLLFALQASAQSNVEWESLVPNQEMSGFTVRGGKAEYKVENGVLIGETRASTPNTFLCTDRVFGDFEMEFEFQVDSELNSGVQFRSNSVAGYGKGVVHGYQAEIDPSERAWTGGVYDESRRGWLADLSDNEEGRKAFQPGKWNQYRIKAVGDRIQTWLNGVLCTDFVDDMTQTGFIGFQVHGVGDRKDPLQVKWRSIRVKDYGFGYRKKPANAEWLIFEGDTVGKWKKSGSPHDKPVEIGWTVEKDGWAVKPGQGDIELIEPHGSCELYMEFMVDENGKPGQGNGNSGVFLMGQYEVQILNSAGQEPMKNNCGSIYSIKSPDYNMAFPAYTWQSFLIHFTAPKWDGDEKVSSARMTVWHNGTMIHRDVEVQRGTSGNGSESPAWNLLRLQDHGNLIKFRHMWMKKK